MSDIAISVENLSKKYHIGRAKQRHDTLRDALVDGLRAPLQRLRRNGSRPEEDTIWALRNVSFEVKKGEVVGLIGRNGAGKSTLLKIMSQITEPTSGIVVMHGRVGSLLEVGTGFHPDLTGRENLFLSGAILGMRRSEIERKYAEIVEFSGVEKFLDTPLKRFSSGMQVRLGFAVAAHLDPQILLIDEVLAVGDAAFRAKSLGKMEEVAGVGRTVLFVSHNMSAIANLCTRVLVVDDGGVIFDGPTDKAVRTYLNNLNLLNSNVEGFVNHQGSGDLRFVDLRMWNDRKQPLEVLSSGQSVLFELVYTADQTIRSQRPVISIAFFDLLGKSLFLCRSDFVGASYAELPSSGSIVCRIPKLPLPPGEFRINLHCRINGTVADWVKDARTVTVIEGDYYGTGTIPDTDRGDLLIEHEWLPVQETPNLLPELS